LFLFFIVPSCQTLLIKNDDRLKPYLDKFIDLCVLYKKDCSSYMDYKYVVEPIPTDIFSLLEGKKSRVIGRCNRILKKITVDENFFNRATSLEIEMVVIHEIGHCVFDMNHSDEYASIMNSFASSYYIYHTFYSYFINEFFKCKENCPFLKFDENFYKK
jgi:predicted metal-dependent hydrolase